MKARDSVRIPATSMQTEKHGHLAGFRAECLALSLTHIFWMQNVPRCETLHHESQVFHELQAEDFPETHIDSSAMWD